MESIKIEKLLEAYFEGETSLLEEQVLRDYFKSENVAEKLQQYKPIFEGLLATAEEHSSRNFEFLKSNSGSKKRWYSVAAILVVALGIGSFYFSQPSFTLEEQEALAAFEKSKETMMLLSENLNKGAAQLTYVGQFGIIKNKIFE